MRYLLDETRLVEKAVAIVNALLEAQSPRMTNITEKVVGKSKGCYKVIQRFLRETDLKKILLRLDQKEAEFVIGDPTEMPGHYAPKTTYVGTLKDGKTPGYYLSHFEV